MPIVHKADRAFGRGSTAQGFEVGKGRLVVVLECNDVGFGVIETGFNGKQYQISRQPKRSTVVVECNFAGALGEFSWDIKISGNICAE